MALPDIPELEAAARAVVHDARRDSTLESLTLRIVREMLEARFDLSEGELDSKEFRKPLKSTIAAAAMEDLPEVQVAPSKSKKRKSEEMKLEEPKPRKKQKEGLPKKSKKGANKFKSLEMVPSSDIEDTGAQDDTSMEVDKLSASEDSAKENQVMPPKLSKLMSQTASGSKPSGRGSPSAVPEKTADSDSELSVLNDEPPKRAKKPKTAKSRDKAGEKSTKSKKNTGLSKDDGTIKRLKSLVLACGVRKVWAKVFQDAEEPSQQIRILKKILTELGMSGRMSLEQAKAIKEKRELAQELEDVQAFAAAATSSKPARSNKEESEASEEEVELAAKRKTNARRSIMDFLGDQSDDD